jgi:hypothetical protein
MKSETNVLYSYAASRVDFDPLWILTLYKVQTNMDYFFGIIHLFDL